MLPISKEVILHRDLATDFMNNDLNKKMRYTPQNSPWISSLRGIDVCGWKCEYEVHEWTGLCQICVLFTGVYGIIGGSCLC
jgi:dolichyl-phosphate-mannose--protein O-mannosyl transferase